MAFRYPYDRYSLRLQVLDRLAAGSPAAEIAEEVGLDLVDGEVILPGYWADFESTARVLYDYASVPEEAAQEYVDGGSWGDTTKTQWIRVEAMWECLGALIRLANRSNEGARLGVRAACDVVEEVLDAEDASDG